MNNFSLITPRYIRKISCGTGNNEARLRDYVVAALLTAFKSTLCTLCNRNINKPNFIEC